MAATKPGSTNTGVPVGTALKVYNGDLNVTKDGTVIEALDIRGSVYVHANNVTIKKSLIRGGPASKSQQGDKAHRYAGQDDVLGRIAARDARRAPGPMHLRTRKGVAADDPDEQEQRTKE